MDDSINFDEADYLLEWARVNLPPPEYNKIKKSYDKLIIYTLLFIIGLIPIMLIFLYIGSSTPFTDKAKANAMPKGATSFREASIDYHDNFYWTYDSKKYEAPLADYGFNPDDFKYGDKVIIYVDDAQNLIKVTEATDEITSWEIEQMIGYIGVIVVPIFLILCVYLPIAFHTFGKPFRAYRKWFYSKT